MRRWRLSTTAPFLAIFALIFVIQNSRMRISDKGDSLEEVGLGEARFPSVAADGSLVEGKPFSNETLEIAKMVDRVKGDHVGTFKNSEVVFVTYASANHFGESRMAIYRLRQETNATLIYYNLGLSEANIKDLEKICNVHVINFNFSAYPPFVKTLSTYAFKPILIAEMYRKYTAFWVIDASARLLDAEKVYNFYEKVRTGDMDPYSAEHPAGHTIGQKTVSGTFEYLPLPPKEKSSGMNQALTMFVVRSPIAKDIVRWNLLCALTRECIAPLGASTACGTGSTSCHRFDQSSVSIIMCVSRLRRGLPCLEKTATSGAYSAFFSVERDNSYNGPLPVC